MKKKVNIPKKGAGQRLAERLKEIGTRKPPESLIEILNQTGIPKIEIQKKTAKPKAELDA